MPLRVGTNIINISSLGKGNKRLAVLEEEISPKKLCRCGKEDIEVPLNTDSEKAGNLSLCICSKSFTIIFVPGFIVEVDGRPLKPQQFRGITNKRIYIPSHPCGPKTKSLHLKVSKESVFETIKLGKNPREPNNLEKIQLLDTDIDYMDVGECTKWCVLDYISIEYFSFSGTTCGHQQS